MVVAMDVSLSLCGAIPVFRLAGRLDATSSPLLEERIKPLLEEQGKKLVFDCDGLTYVSSAGLRVFLTCQRQLSAHGGGVAFASLSTPVKDLFHLAGLQDLFMIEANAEAAAARLG
jgi:anti-anti-sigma factor